jgi:hypothetical protein
LYCIAYDESQQEQGRSDDSGVDFFIHDYNDENDYKDKDLFGGSDDEGKNTKKKEREKESSDDGKDWDDDNDYEDKDMFEEVVTTVIASSL